MGTVPPRRPGGRERREGTGWREEEEGAPGGGFPVGGRSRLGRCPPVEGGNARAWGPVAVTSARPGAFPNTNFHPLPASCWCWGCRIGQGTALGCVGIKGGALWCCRCQGDSTGGTPRGCSGLPFPVLGEDQGGRSRAGTAPSLPVPSQAAVGVTSADNHLQPAPLYAGTWLNKGSGQTFGKQTPVKADSPGVLHHLSLVTAVPPLQQPGPVPRSPRRSHPSPPPSGTGRTTARCGEGQGPLLGS